MKKLLQLLILMFPFFAMGQSPVIVTQPYKFQKYVHVAGSLFSDTTLLNGDSSKRAATTDWVKRNFPTTIQPNSVISGLGLTVMDSLLTVGSGTWIINNIVHNKGTPTNFVLSARDSAYSRYETVYATSSNTIGIVVGILSPTPVEPTIPNGTIRVGAALITPTGTFLNQPGLNSSYIYSAPTVKQYAFPWVYSIKADTLKTGYYVFPSGDGFSGQVMQTDGAGHVFWSYQAIYSNGYGLLLSSNTFSVDTLHISTIRGMRDTILAHAAVVGFGLITSGDTLKVDTSVIHGGGGSVFASNGLNKDVDTIKMGDSNLKHPIEIRDSLFRIDFILDTAYAQIGIVHHRGEVELYVENGYAGTKESVLDLFAGDSTLSTHNEFANLYIYNNINGGQKGFYIDETGIKVRADIDSLALYYNGSYSEKSIVAFGDRYIPDVGYVKVLIDSLGATLPSQTGNAGKVLFTDGTTTNWGTVAGTGTVTSVGATGSNGVLVTGGSPVTGAGVLTFEVDSSKYATLDKLSTYLTKAQTVATYLTQSNAASTYLTQSNAASTYQPLISLTLTGSGNPTFAANVLNIPQYTFNNGLTNTSGTVVLGGTLGTGTSLSLGGFTFSTSDLASSNASHLEFTEGNGSFFFLAGKATGANTTSARISVSSGSGGNVGMSIRKLDGSSNATVQNISVDATNGIIVQDQITAKGAAYALNYDANFTGKSLIDKRYGDSTAKAKADSVSGKVKYNYTIFTPTTGGTVNLVNNQYNVINPTGALLALTVNLPSSPVSKDAVMIKFTQNVTTVTYTGGTVVDGITAPTAGGLTILVYDSGTNSWY